MLELSLHVTDTVTLLVTATETLGGADLSCFLAG